MCTYEITAAVEPLTMEEIKKHTSNVGENASVYVGTYHKYNCGSLKGAWVNLESFGDVDELMEFLHRLHSDEEAPEFMIQDFQNFPKKFYSESMGYCDFCELFKWIQLNDEQREMCAEYWDEVDEGASIDEIIDNFVYSGDSDEYFDNLADEQMEAYNVPDFLKYHFDYESWRRDCAFDYHITRNFVFVAR